MGDRRAPGCGWRRSCVAEAFEEIHAQPYDFAGCIAISRTLLPVSNSIATCTSNWHFHMDPKDNGELQRWFDRESSVSNRDAHGFTSARMASERDRPTGDVGRLSSQSNSLYGIAPIDRPPAEVDTNSRSLTCKSIFTSTSQTGRGRVRSRRVPAIRRDSGQSINGPIACPNSAHSCLE
jgi:hypothetical protein